MPSGIVLVTRVLHVHEDDAASGTMVTKTTPVGGTSALKLPTEVPRSARAHTSRTDAELNAGTCPMVGTGGRVARDTGRPASKGV